MPNRYDDRDYERERQNYGRRSESEYGRSYSGRAQGRYRYGDNERESERYGREQGFRDEYSGRYSPTSGRRYEGGGQGDRGEQWQDEPDYRTDRDREYGGYGRSYSDEGRYSDRGSRYSQRYNYPTGFRSGESYGGSERPDYERGRYGRGEERDFEYERGGYGSGEGRGWWDRASDEVASWFGDEEAERRRRMDQQREELRGRGPKGYRRSDERIKEDVNDRLSEGYLDASDVEVTVQNSEVSLTGTVKSRRDKRRAEDIADSVTGVTNVENRLRVTQSSLDSFSKLGTTEPTSTTATSTPSGTTGRGKAAGS